MYVCVYAVLVGSGQVFSMSKNCKQCMYVYVDCYILVFSVRTEVE